MSSKKYGVDMPSTLERSPAKAQRTYAKALRSAEEEYGSGERAGRTAYAALKHGFEKVGDHWEGKDHKGPSDPQAAQSGRAAREHPKQTAGGADEQGHSRDELYQQAKSLDIKGRSKMSKAELARAVASRRH